MANIMSLRQIRNKTSRDGFDLSFKHCFSAKAGQLLPIMCKPVIPGDKFRINTRSITRTIPVTSPAYVRLREYYDFFFVPMRLLWRYFDAFATQMPNFDSAWSADTDVLDSASVVPYCPHTTKQQLNSFMAQVKNPSAAGVNHLNIFGRNRFGDCQRLLSYLGYGQFDEIYTGSSSERINLFSLAAYQKIYSDYFRFDSWEVKDPALFNFDYLTPDDVSSPFSCTRYVASTSSIFDLRYSNWNKDLFMGLIPEPQWNGESVAPLTGNLSFINSTAVNTVKEGTWAARINPADSNANGGLSIIALRQAQALQKWKEISISGNTDYKTQIEKHFGVKVSDDRSNLCKWLGGFNTNVNLDAVVNQNLDSATQVAEEQGRGTASGKGYIDFESNGEYGYLMCIYHVQPLPDYQGTAIAKCNTAVEPTDWPIPEFDKIGMEQVNLYQLIDGYQVANKLIDNIPLGYAPRYIDYKTSVDIVSGVFLSSYDGTSSDIEGRGYSYWVSPISREYIKDFLESNSRKLNYLFFKVNPAILSNLFLADQDSTSYETDAFLVNSYFDIKSVRNLDYDGLPY